MDMTAYQNEIKKKRVPWNHFDRLLNCFKNDKRIFLITDDDKKNCVKNYQMTMENIISFWDGGIEGADLRLTMLDIMEAASKLEIYEQTHEACWSIKRIA